MTGLVLKDILVMRKTLKTYILFLIFYALLAVIGVFDVSIITSMIQVIIMLLPISAFSYDEQAEWDRYAMALPLGRHCMVSARYLFALLMVLGAAAFGLAVCVFLAILNSGSLVESLATVLVSLGVGLLITDIILPLNYKLGPERARPYLYAIVFLPIIILFGSAKLGLFKGMDLSFLDRMSQTSVLAVFALVPLAALLAMGVSCLISCRILDGKEF